MTGAQSDCVFSPAQLRCLHEGHAWKRLFNMDAMWCSRCDKRVSMIALMESAWSGLAKERGREDPRRWWRR